jgi:DUF917 family protein
MLREVTLDDIHPIALGAGILGTGGGGNPYLGTLHLHQVMREYGAAQIVDPFDLPDDALLPCIGYIGAPTASIEKMQEGTELLRALRLLEDHIGRKADGLVIAEIGGANSMGPLCAGLQAGIPVVDCDSMGRAFPELPMSVFMFYGDATVAPFAMADAGGSSIVVPHTVSAAWAERLARNLATSMGATAGLCGFIVSGAQVKQRGIHYTLSLAHRIGLRVIEAQDAGDDVPDAISDLLSGRILLRGKIVDVNRRTTRGFARGTLTIEGFGVHPDRLYIEFQNEFLIAYLNGEVIATVPDLITIVTDDTGEPVSTEILRYGYRVAVLGIPGAAQLKTATALKVVGPRAFGYDVDFAPMPGNSIGVDFREERQHI